MCVPEQNNDCEVTLAPLLKLAPVHYWLFVIQGTAHASTAHIAIRREEKDREERREGGGGK